MSNVRVNMGRMKYGYARTSTDDQTTALSAEQIEHARELIDAGESREYVCDFLNVGRATLYWASRER